MDTFQIRSYGIGELARCYAPNITAGAARRKLMYWIPCSLHWSTRFMRPASARRCAALRPLRSA